MTGPIQLEPVPELPSTLLPPTDESSGVPPQSAGSVRCVYAHGIEFIDQMATIDGMFAGFSWSAASLLIAFVVYAYVDWPVIFFLHWMMGIGAIIFLALGRADSIGWRYQAVLFDRAAQKIHVFTDLGSPWWEIWRLLGGTRHRIDTFDWKCARGEVAVVPIMGGAGVLRNEYALTIAVTDFPKSYRVRARFGVGFTTGYDDGMTQVARWEHIRRYMRGEGPALSPGDALYPDDSREHWIGAFTSGQPLLGPGSKPWWTGEALNGAWFLTIPGGLLFLFILPMTLPYSLFRWLVRRFKGTPRWPAEILASVGPTAANEPAPRQKATPRRRRAA